MLMGLLPVSLTIFMHFTLVLPRPFLLTRSPHHRLIGVIQNILEQALKCFPTDAFALVLA